MAKHRREAETARDRKPSRGSKFETVYPGKGWADNNLTDAQKQGWSDDVSGDHWDTMEVLLAAWEQGYQITLKRDRGKADVFMAVMTNTHPDAPDRGVWLSMRGSSAADALSRVLWVWAVPYGRELRPPDGTTGGDIW